MINLIDYECCIDCRDVHQGWLDNVPDNKIQECEKALNDIAITEGGYWLERTEENAN